MGRRGWLGLGLAAVVILVTVVLLLPTIMARLHPPDVREPGEWRFTHRVEPVAGTAVGQRILTADEELTILQAEDEVAQCTVDAEPGRRRRRVPRRGARDRSPSARSAIHGRIGSYVDDRPQDPYLTWAYAPGARATVTCTRGAISPATLRDVADGRALRRHPGPAPVHLRALPEGYRIYSIDSDSRADIVSLSAATRRPGVAPVRRGALRQ